MPSETEELRWSEVVCPECGEQRLEYEAEGYCTLTVAVNEVSDRLHMRRFISDTGEVEEDLNGRVERVWCFACGAEWTGDDGRDPMDVILDQAAERATPGGGEGDG